MARDAADIIIALHSETDRGCRGNTKATYSFYIVPQPRGRRQLNVSLDQFLLTSLEHCPSCVQKFLLSWSFSRSFCERSENIMYPYLALDMLTLCLRYMM